jgi:enoyl-CoA hydratase/carnithine racemase
MSYNTIRYEVSEQILTIMLNRPEQLNAFTVEMAKELGFLCRHGLVGRRQRIRIE